MKINLFHLIASTLFVLGMCPISSNAQWSYIGNQNISDGWTTNNQIVCKSDGSPIIAYTKQGQGFCKIWDGISWEDLGLFLADLNVGTVYDLQIDLTDRIVLSYEDAISGKPSVIRLDSGIWNVVGSNDLHTGFVSELSIAIDNNNSVWSALMTSDGFKLYKEFNGNWELQSTMGIPTNVGIIDLAFDLGGYLLMAFTDVNELKGNVMRLDNSAWSSIGTPNYTTGFAQENRIVVASNGEIYHGFDMGVIHLNKFNTTTQNWDATVPPGLGSNMNGIWDLRADQSNNVYFSTSQIASDRARCFRINDSFWEQLDANGINNASAGYPEIAIANGQLYATYNDFDLSAASVKKFDGSLNLNQNYQTFEVFPNPFDDRIYLNIDGANSSDFTFTVISTLGEVVFHAYGISNEASFDLTIPSGLYIAIIDYGGQRMLKRIVKR